MTELSDRELLNAGYRYALSLTHDRQAAEDVLHDAWANVIAANGPLNKGYLFTSIRNRWISIKRREKVVRFDALPDDDLLVANGERADTRAARRDLLEQVLERLQPQEREALYLNAVEGYSATEIGKLCGKSRNTVLSWLHRGRQRIAAAFPSRTDEEVVP